MWLREWRRTSETGLFCGTNTNTLSMISESGLYRMVMRRDKPEAKAFQD
jgi:prophage antirepressor-like protein